MMIVNIKKETINKARCKAYTIGIIESKLFDFFFSHLCVRKNFCSVLYVAVEVIKKMRYKIKLDECF